MKPLILSAFVLLALATHQASTQPPATEAASGGKATPRVHIFFDESKVLEIAEVEQVARQALKSRGYEIDSTFPCASNVVVGGRSAGCAVLFHKAYGEMGYDVSFGTNGDVVNVLAAKIEHATPPKGSPKPKLPSGGVKRSIP